MLEEQVKALMRVCASVFGALLLICTGSVAANEAVLSFVKDGGRHYTITFLDDDLNPQHELSLGKLKAATHGYWNKQGSEFWYSARAASEKEWSLVGYAPHSKAEVARIPIGKRSPAHPKLGRMWSEHSLDENYLFALTLVKNEWHVESFSTKGFQKIAATAIDKGHVELTQIANNKVLVVSDHINFGNKRIYLIDPISGEILFQDKIKNSDKPTAVVSPDKAVVYLITQDLKKFPRKDDARLKKEGRLVNVRVIDSATGEVSQNIDLGYDLTAFNVVKDRDALYAASRQSVIDGGVTVWKFLNGTITEHHSSKDACEPVSTIVDEQRDRATVFCKKVAVHFENDAAQTAKVGIAAKEAFYAKNSDSVYMLERGGSEIAKLDLNPLRFVDDHSTGRGGVKFGQGVLSVMGIAVAAYTGFAVISIPSYRYTALQTDEAETKVYAMNLGTRDVTIVDGESFAKLGYVGTGRGSFALARYDDSPYVFAFAVSQVTVFDPQTDTPVKTLKDGQFVGANGELDRLYWAPKTGGLMVYSLSSLEELAHLPELGEVYLVPTLGPEPTQLY